MTNTKLNKLQSARKEAVNSIIRGYGASREYAIVLNDTFAFDWFTIKPQDTSDEAKPLLAEKKEFYKELKEGMHTNPSVAWGRVCSFGKEERYGKAEPEGGSGEGDGAGDGEGASDGSPNRSPLVRNIDELVLLYKFNNKQENLPLQIVEAQKHIISALGALGLDVAKL